MKRKDRVLNLRVRDRQRTVYERAAALEGIWVSALVTSAADARAGELLHSHASMTVPDVVVGHYTLMPYFIECETLTQKQAQDYRSESRAL